MPNKPHWREDDENPKRQDDISIPVPWSEKPFTANGTQVVNVLLWVALIGGGIWHHTETQKQFSLNREVQLLQASYQAQNVCILRLDPEQRQEDRLTQKYCPDPLEEIRRYIRYKEKAQN